MSRYVSKEIESSGSKLTEALHLVWCIKDRKVDSECVFGKFE